MLLKFFNTILDCIFYKKCYFCGKKTEINSICTSCFEKLQSNICKTVRTIEGVKIVGYYPYQGDIQKLIRAIKYHNKKDLAIIAAKLISMRENFDEETEIIPVPLHKKRQRSRSYNQMELITQSLGAKTNNKLIKRIKNTKPQYRLTSKEREKNLAGAFEVNPAAYSGGKLVIFDDICTTGSTIKEIILELKKHNITNISGLVLSFAGKIQ